jgi:hypothetical protein
MEKEKLTESKVIIENGEVKTIFSEDIQNNGGWMSVDEFVRIGDEWINKMIDSTENANNNT